MTYVNFDSGISFVINVPDGHKAHTNCTAGQQEGFQSNCTKKQSQNSEWERCDGDLIFTKGYITPRPAGNLEF